MPDNLIDQVIAKLTEEDMRYLESKDINNITFYLIEVLDERLKEIENKVFKKNGRTKTTLAQQILILKHLGIIENIRDLEITVEAKGKLLSALLNGDAENAEKFFNLTIYDNNDTPLHTPTNYSFLTTLFKSLKLEEKAKEIEHILESINKKNDRIKRSPL